MCVFRFIIIIIFAAFLFIFSCKYMFLLYDTVFAACVWEINYIESMKVMHSAS